MYCTAIRYALLRYILWRIVLLTCVNNKISPWKSIENPIRFEWEKRSNNKIEFAWSRQQLPRCTVSRSVSTYCAFIFYTGINRLTFIVNISTTKKRKKLFLDERFLFYVWNIGTDWKILRCYDYATVTKKKSFDLNKNKLSRDNFFYSVWIEKT